VSKILLMLLVFLSPAAFAMSNDKFCQELNLSGDPLASSDYLIGEYLKHNNIRSEQAMEVRRKMEAITAKLDLLTSNPSFVSSCLKLLEESDLPEPE